MSKKNFGKRDISVRAAENLRYIFRDVYFQNARTSQSVSMVGSMVEIKRSVVCHVAVVSIIVGGGGGGEGAGAVTNVVKLATRPHCYYLSNKICLT